MKLYELISRIQGLGCNLHFGEPDDNLWFLNNIDLSRCVGTGRNHSQIDDRRSRK